MHCFPLARALRGAASTHKICSVRTAIESADKHVRRGFGPMYENPLVEKHRQQLDSVSKDHYKQTTGLTGLRIEEKPHQQLVSAYSRLLRSLENFPADCAYRVHTEELAKHRLNLVQTEPNVHKLEEKIGMGQLEEVLEQAVLELQASRILLEYKIWEPLVEPAAEEQWRWPIH